MAQGWGDLAQPRGRRILSMRPASRRDAPIPAKEKWPHVPCVPRAALFLSPRSGPPNTRLPEPDNSRISAFFYFRFLSLVGLADPVTAPQTSLGSMGRCGITLTDVGSQKKKHPNTHFLLTRLAHPHGVGVVGVCGRLNACLTRAHAVFADQFCRHRCDCSAGGVLRQL